MSAFHPLRWFSSLDRDSKLVVCSAACATSANVTLLVSGHVGHSWSQQTGAGSNLSGSLLLFLAKNHPVGFAFAQGLYLSGSVLTNLQGVMEGRPDVIAGTTALVLGLGFGALSGWLENKFARARNRFVRCILGAPRRTMGALMLVGKVPLAQDARAQGDFGYVATLFQFAASDILTAFSHPKPQEKRPAPSCANNQAMP